MVPYFVVLLQYCEQGVESPSMSPLGELLRGGVEVSMGRVDELLRGGVEAPMGRVDELLSSRGGVEASMSRHGVVELDRMKSNSPKYDAVFMGI